MSVSIHAFYIQLYIYFNDVKLKFNLQKVQQLMTRYFFSLFFFFFCIDNCFSAEFTDAKVFNWRFYLQANPDLMSANLVSESQARSHWLNYGIDEGRQAHPAFQTRQYLDKYPDLANAFGKTNYRAALNHYLSSGYSEQRTGYFNQGAYTPGDANIMGKYGRITISNTSGIETPDTYYISASIRNAGAIDSIYWNGKELVNSYDHGRQLQYAWQYQSSVNSNNSFSTKFAECFNPTEAGSGSDKLNWNSTSILNTYSYMNGHFETSSHVAYWSSVGSSDVNIMNGTPCETYNLYSSNISNDVLKKNVSIISSPFIPTSFKLFKINASVVFELIASKFGNIALEVPTIYLAPELNNMYSLNLQTKALSLLSKQLIPTCDPKFWALANGCFTDFPVIAATDDGQYAVGMLFKPLNSLDSFKYGYYYFNQSQADSSNDVSKTTKISVEANFNNIGQYNSFQTYIAIGTLDSVKQALNYAVVNTP